MNRKLTHWIWVSLFTISLGLFFIGCEGRQGDSADSNPGTPVAVSGDATLRVQVQTYNTNIYLDDKYIGTIAAGSSQSWSIPSGQHTLKATNATADYNPEEQTFAIESGQIFTASISWTTASGT